jgi:Zn-dependent peptidase ImmA (M78 family)
MAFDLALLATKLRRYREQFQVSFLELAEATGIEEEILQAYENGDRQPTGDDILVLADYYKCDYKFFVSNERVAPFDQTETLFRRYGNEFSRQDRWAVQEFLHLAECESFLLQSLGRSNQEPFAFTKRGTYYKGHGIAAADALRQKLGYSNLEIGMDIYSDFRAIGIHIFRRKLENSSISGLYIKHPAAGKCVLINYSEDVYRQRFTAAHEAAHAILDDEEDVIVSLTGWKKGDLIEIRANTFASHYLMPPGFLSQIPEVNRWNAEKALAWASKLKVSTEALAYALSEANLINNITEEEIKGVNVPKTAKIDPELPESLSTRASERRQELLKRGLSQYYVTLCFEGYREGIISAARMAEMLLIREWELYEIARLYGERFKYDD